MTDFPIKIAFSPSGRTATFRNAADLFDYCAKELSAWDWTKAFTFEDWRTPQGHHQNNPLRHRCRDRLRALEQAAAASDVDQSISALTSLYASDGIPHSRDSDGILINEIAKISAQYGMGALHTATGVQRPPEQFGLEPGAIMYWAKKAKSIDFSSDADAVKAATADAAGVVEAAHNHLINGRLRLRRDFLKYLKQLRQLRRNTHAQISDDHSKAIASIAAVENSYLKQMTLQAPVAYWKARALTHSAQFKRLSIAASIYATLSAVVLAVGGFVFLRSEIDNIISKDAPSQLIFLEISLFLMIATIIFWVGRILSKIMLSERHLASDAAERAVMAETYLALLHDGAVTDAERPLVLNALFRASTDGIVKDEGGGDPSVAALLARALVPNAR